MELHFSSSVCQYLRKAACQIINQEQTQELRLPDALPDIGRVLGSWGQIVIRSKEWRGSGMNVSGGVMTRVFYAPEDGTQPQVLECWIPIQLKWDFPQTQRDGTICVMPLLRSVDARSVSARKLMVRATVSVLGEALEPVETEVYTAQDIPEDIQLLTRVYPAELPLEAGEKAFQMEEELMFPANMPPVSRILHYSLIPVVAEHKVLAGRLVFRGEAGLKLVYMTDDGQICAWNWELPFSQYTELDKDYSPNADAYIVPMVTAVELDHGEGDQWLLKAGIAAQYVIYDRVMLELTMDAYSPKRQVKVKQSELVLPMHLDTYQQEMTIRPEWNDPTHKILDSVWYFDHPRQDQNEDQLDLEIPGQFQILYLDEEGQLQGATLRTEDRFTMHNDHSNQVDSYVRCITDTGAVSGTLSADAQISCFVTGMQGLPMVTGLEVGEILPEDTMRPSLVLRRAGDHTLWEIAKSCGSTVDAIKKANGLEEEPTPAQMLLIPVS